MMRNVHPGRLGPSRANVSRTSHLRRAIASKQTQSPYARGSFEWEAQHSNIDWPAARRRRKREAISQGRGVLRRNFKRSSLISFGDSSDRPTAVMMVTFLGPCRLAATGPEFDRISSTRVLPRTYARGSMRPARLASVRGLFERGTEGRIHLPQLDSSAK